MLNVTFTVNYYIMFASKNVYLSVVLFLLTCLLIPSVVFSANTVENSWVSLTPMHTERGSFGVAVVDGKIYAIGGLC
jgi:hypothetical protein